MQCPSPPPPQSQNKPEKMGLQDSIGKAINPERERGRSINMQMKIMTRSAYFKGFCVTDRRFHCNKAIFKNLQENEVLK